MAVKLWNSTNATAIGNLFRDQYGYIHVVGNGNLDTTTELYYAISIDSGATFTDGEGGGAGSYKTLDSLYFSKRPDIVVDSNDNIFVFCADHNDNLYYIKKTSGSGGGWGTKTLIGDKTQSELLAEIDTDDNLIVFATDGSNRTVFTSIDAGVNWVEELDVSFSGNLQDICLGYNQHIWSIYSFQSFGTYKTVVNKLTKTEGVPDSWIFGSDETESTDTYQINSNAIVCERTSEIIWEFVSRNIGGTHTLQYRKKIAGVWGSWIDIVSGVSSYQKISVIRNYDDEIYLFYHRGSDLYYVIWDGGNWSEELTVKSSSLYIRIEHGELASGDRIVNYIYKPSGNIETWFDSILVPLRATIIETVTVSDAIEINLSREQALLDDTITVSDSLELSVEEHHDINHDFRIAIDVITDIPHDFRSVIESQTDVSNTFRMTYANALEDIESDIRYVTEPTYDIPNDFRMLHLWQVPGDAGFQSLGKEYIKIYINGVQDDDVDIDSVNITKLLNSSHTASFIIGRPYDTINKPTLEHEVEIRYYESNWSNYCLLYKGYITQIVPGDSPDFIRINCQDKYWLRNREQKYFFVGHEPQDNQELYYNTVSQGLSACGVSFGIGDFTPQTMDFFGRGESDTISALVQNSGHYAWFYDVNENKKLWTAGQGSIINLERQELDKNIQLYQVLKHSFSESVSSIVNRFRVTMGNKIIRRFNDSGGNKEYDGYYYHLDTTIELIPAWDSIYERLATDDYIPAHIASTSEEIDAYGEGGTVPQIGTSGVFRHTQEENDLYKNVYTKYTIGFISLIPGGLDVYTDRFEPKLRIHAPASPINPVKYSGGDIAPTTFNPVLDEGYSIDYKNNTVTFGERKYFYTEDETGKTDSIRKPIVGLTIWKKRFQSTTGESTDDPEDPNDIVSPLVFITNKLGNYPTTIWKSLQLAGLGIQIGGWQITGYDENSNPIKQFIPSWNDTAFAYDVAYWELSKTADKRITGSIDLTIDTCCHYGIDLAKKIMIDGVLEDSLNIESITYNLSNFTVTIQLTNARYYKRSVSIQARGV